MDDSNGDCDDQFMNDIVKIVEDDTSSTLKRKNKRKRRYLEDLFIITTMFDGPSYRDAKLSRLRWNCDYLVDLAINEKTFVAEYRLDPRSFDLLGDILKDDLSVDDKMSAVSTKSGIIFNINFTGYSIFFLFYKDIFLNF
jgi:hypothetical protein